MANTYVNKVVKSNGEVLLDISDSTAVAADVAQGKYFYLATGEKVAGTASGSGGYDNLSGSITVPARTQSITIDPEGTRRYFLLVTSDRVLRKGLGYKACSLVLVDFDENITSYITTNNGGTDTMGYQGALTLSVNRVVRNGTAITLSSDAITGRTFGYFVDTSYDWFAFDELGNSGQEPSGTIQILQNGTYNVRDYASADVNVPVGADVPQFRVLFDSSWETVTSVTCDKTYAECLSSYEDSYNEAALVLFTDGIDTGNDYSNPLHVMKVWTDHLTYSYFTANYSFDINYYQDGTALFSEPSAYANPLSVTTNGTYVPSDNGVYTTVTVNVPASGGGGAEDSIIQRTISGSYVNSTATNIGAYAFEYCLNLNSVRFTEATTIGSEAFYSCWNLRTAIFPKVTAISYAAFSACSALSTASFPMATVIGSQAFYGCSALKTVDFHLVSEIGSSAFQGCRSLTSLQFPELQTIGNMAFQSCVSLVSFSASKVRYIGSNAFYSCSKLTEIAFPLVPSIASSAFMGCYVLAKATFINASTIMSSAFAYCSQMSTAVFMNNTESVGTIHSSAFYRCRTLLSLYLLGNYISLKGNTLGAFSSTPINGYTTYTDGVYGSIYVPASMYETYMSGYPAGLSARFVSLTSEQVQHVLEYGTHVM